MYIGNTPTTQSFISGTDYFSGNGSTVAFTLSRAVVSVNDIEAVVNNVVQQPNTAYTISGTTITFTSAPSSGSSNIYVRYLSTTTQSITPSQGTVSYSTLNSDNQSKLGISFKNRIINGAMVIDQRNAGASVTASTTNSWVYTLDRWAYYATGASKYTVQQNAGSVTPPAGFTNYLGITSSAATTVTSTDVYDIKQSIEGYNIADLNWGSANAKTVTLSFWVRSSLTGAFGGSLVNADFNRLYPFSYTISAANTWEQKTITVTGDATGNWLTTNGIGLNVVFGLGVGSTYSGTAGAWTSSTAIVPTGSTSVVSTSGATWYITGVQLEVGTQATTFDYRSIGTELQLCQRYFQYLSSGNSSSNYFAYGTGFIASSTYGFFQIPMVCSMRANPSITYNTVSQYRVGFNTCTAIQINSASPSSLSIRADSTGLTTGQGAQFDSNNNTTSYIGISAEL